MIPHHTRTNHGRQLISLVNRVSSGIGNTILSIIRNDIHISRSPQTMSWREGDTHGSPIFL
ncbi:Uncharacterised protein [Segatella copri]|nr:Uncharacterised protein [Segatella copri]